MSDFESVLQAEVDEREAAARAATAQEAEAREAERERFVAAPVFGQAMSCEL